MRLSEKAALFAAERHEGHKRKFGGEPYFSHLAVVAEMVKAAGADEATVAAAYLHDTVEDVGVTYAELEREFGSEVAALVREVSKVSALSDGGRAVRKALDRAHYAKASAAG